MLTEKAYAGEFLLSESAGTRSRENVTIDASQTLLAGQVLGQITRGAQTVAAAVAFAGNTGTGTVGSLTGDTAIPAGDYKILVIEPAANAGAFAVYKPDGTLDGHGTVAVAYNGSINFTLSDATDFVAGDGFTVAVSYAAGSNRYVMHDPEGTDGREAAAGILYDGVTTAAGETAKAVAIVRDAEVISARLKWDDQDTTEKAAALAILKVAGIIAR